jgi:signal transduction histidine kinase
MMTMSIRSKLFLSFIAVVAVPLAMLLVGAQWYLRSTRAELDQRFLQEVRRIAMREQNSDTESMQKIQEIADGHGAPTVAQLRGESISTTSTIDIPHIFEQSSAINAVGVWDPVTNKMVSWKSRAGGEMPVGLEGLLIGQLKAYSESETSTERVWSVFDVGPPSLIYALGKREGKVVVLEVDGDKIASTIRFGQEGRVFYAEHGRPCSENPDPDLAAIAELQVPHGETRDFYDATGRLIRVYAAVSAETAAMAIARGFDLYAAMPVDEIYAPLAHFGYKVGGAVALSLLLALALASRLSRRFVGDIERIRETVAAIGRGDWKRIEASSSDELGGALVNSINEMAAALAARSMREETEGWRRLVRVLSHEINNTLAPVRSVAATMQTSVGKRLREDDAGADLDQALRLIVERVDALSSFIAGSAEVAKVPEPQRQMVDVDRLVEDATRMFNEQAQARDLRLQVRREEEGAGAASIDVRQVERVIVNLVKNAIEAVPNGGSVWVLSARRGSDVEIVVEDDGHGISVDARRSLFVPYFTTKQGGSGIGLALVKQIVAAHGGTVTAEDRDGGGTRMRVRLPGGVSSHPYREQIPA